MLFFCLSVGFVVVVVVGFVVVVVSVWSSRNNFELGDTWQENVF